MSEWIDHDGKNMPMRDTVNVCVKFRDGDPTFETFPLPAGNWDPNWFYHRGNKSESDIIAYRIVS